VKEIVDSTFSLNLQQIIDSLNYLLIILYHYH